MTVLHAFWFLDFFRAYCNYVKSESQTHIGLRFRDSVDVKIKKNSEQHCNFRELKWNRSEFKDHLPKWVAVIEKWVI